MNSRVILKIILLGIILMLWFLPFFVVNIFGFDNFQGIQLHGVVDMFVFLASMVLTYSLKEDYQKSQSSVHTA